MDHVDTAGVGHKAPRTAPAGSAVGVGFQLRSSPAWHEGADAAEDAAASALPRLSSLDPSHRRELYTLYTSAFVAAASGSGNGGQQLRMKREATGDDGHGAAVLSRAAAAVSRLSSDALLAALPAALEWRTLLADIADPGPGGLPALKLLGLLLQAPAAAQQLPESCCPELIQLLRAGMQPEAGKERVKLCMWLVQTQQLPASRLAGSGSALLAALQGCMPLANPWGSPLVSNQAVRAVARLLAQLPEEAVSAAGGWGPALWPLMTAAPPPEGQSQRLDTYRQLRAEAVALTLQLTAAVRAAVAASRGDGSAADGGDSKAAAIAAAEAELLSRQLASQLAGTLKELESMVLPLTRLPRNAPLPPAAAVAAATDALAAWGAAASLLGAAFVRVARLGQRMLDLVKPCFTCTTIPELPLAAFAAWRHLCSALHAHGELPPPPPPHAPLHGGGAFGSASGSGAASACVGTSVGGSGGSGVSRLRLLVAPVEHAIKHDRRPDVRAAALECWQHLLRLLKAPYCSPYCGGGEGLLGQLQPAVAAAAAIAEGALPREPVATAPERQPGTSAHGVAATTGAADALAGCFTPGLLCRTTPLRTQGPSDAGPQHAPFSALGRAGREAEDPAADKGGGGGVMQLPSATPAPTARGQARAVVGAWAAVSPDVWRVAVLPVARAALLHVLGAGSGACGGGGSPAAVEAAACNSPILDGVLLILHEVTCPSALPCLLELLTPLMAGPQQSSGPGPANPATSSGAHSSNAPAAPASPSAASAVVGSGGPSAAEVAALLAANPDPWVALLCRMFGCLLARTAELSQAAVAARPASAAGGGGDSEEGGGGAAVKHTVVTSNLKAEWRSWRALAATLLPQLPRSGASQQAQPAAAAGGDRVKVEGIGSSGGDGGGEVPGADLARMDAGVAPWLLWLRFCRAAITLADGHGGSSGAVTTARSPPAALVCMLRLSCGPACARLLQVLLQAPATAEVLRSRSTEGTPAAAAAAASGGVGKGGADGGQQGGLQLRWTDVALSWIAMGQVLQPLGPIGACGAGGGAADDCAPGASDESVDEGDWWKGPLPALVRACGDSHAAACELAAACGATLSPPLQAAGAGGCRDADPRVGRKRRQRSPSPFRAPLSPAPAPRATPPPPSPQTMPHAAARSPSPAPTRRLFLPVDTEAGPPWSPSLQRCPYAWGLWLAAARHLSGRALADANTGGTGGKAALLPAEGGPTANSRRQQSAQAIAALLGAPLEALLLPPAAPAATAEGANMQDGDKGGDGADLAADTTLVAAAWEELLAALLLHSRRSQRGIGSAAGGPLRSDAVQAAVVNLAQGLTPLLRMRSDALRAQLAPPLPRDGGGSAVGGEAVAACDVLLWRLGGRAALSLASYLARDAEAPPAASASAAHACGAAEELRLRTQPVGGGGAGTPAPTARGRSARMPHGTPARSGVAHADLSRATPGRSAPTASAAASLAAVAGPPTAADGGLASHGSGAATELTTALIEATVSALQVCAQHAAGHAKGDGGYGGKGEGKVTIWSRSAAASALADALNSLPDLLVPSDSAPRSGTAAAGGGAASGPPAAAALAAAQSALEALQPPLLTAVVDLLPLLAPSDGDGGGGDGKDGVSELRELHLATAVVAVLGTLCSLRRRGADVAAALDGLSPWLAACLRFSPCGVADAGADGTGASTTPGPGLLPQTTCMALESLLAGRMPRMPAAVTQHLRALLLQQQQRAYAAHAGSKHAAASVPDSGITGSGLQALLDAAGSWAAAGRGSGAATAAAASGPGGLLPLALPPAVQQAVDALGWDGAFMLPDSQLQPTVTPHLARLRRAQRGEEGERRQPAGPPPQAAPEPAQGRGKGKAPPQATPGRATPAMGGGKPSTGAGATPRRDAGASPAPRGAKRGLLADSQTEYVRIPPPAAATTTTAGAAAADGVGGGGGAGCSPPRRRRRVTGINTYTRLDSSQAGPVGLIGLGSESQSCGSLQAAEPPQEAAREPAREEAHVQAREPAHEVQQPAAREQATAPAQEPATAVAGPGTASGGSILPGKAGGSNGQQVADGEAAVPEPRDALDAAAPHAVSCPGARPDAPSPPQPAVNAPSGHTPCAVARDVRTAGSVPAAGCNRTPRPSALHPWAVGGGRPCRQSGDPHALAPEGPSEAAQPRCPDAAGAATALHPPPPPLAAVAANAVPPSTGGFRQPYPHFGVAMGPFHTPMAEMFPDGPPSPPLGTPLDSVPEGYVAPPSPGPEPAAHFMRSYQPIFHRAADADPLDVIPDSLDPNAGNRDSGHGSALELSEGDVRDAGGDAGTAGAPADGGGGDSPAVGGGAISDGGGLRDADERTHLPVTLNAAPVAGTASGVEAPAATASLQVPPGAAEAADGMAAVGGFDGASQLDLASGQLGPAFTRTHPAASPHVPHTALRRSSPAAVKPASVRGASPAPGFAAPAATPLTPGCELRAAGGGGAAAHAAGASRAAGPHAATPTAAPAVAAAGTAATPAAVRPTPAESTGAAAVDGVDELQVEPTQEAVTGGRRKRQRVTERATPSVGAVVAQATEAAGGVGAGAPVRRDLAGSPAGLTASREAPALEAARVAGRNDVGAAVAPQGVRGVDPARTGDASPAPDEQQQRRQMQSADRPPGDPLFQACTGESAEAAMAPMAAAQAAPRSPHARAPEGSLKADGGAVSPVARDGPGCDGGATGGGDEGMAGSGSATLERALAELYSTLDGGLQGWSDQRLLRASSKLLELQQRINAELLRRQAPAAKN